MKTKKNYKSPQLKKGSKWYVEYSYYDPESDKTIRKRDYEGLNVKGISIRKRQQIADESIKDISEWLKNYSLEATDSQKVVSNLTLIEEITELLKIKKKNSRPTSYKHYSYSFNRIQDFLKFKGLDHIKPKGFTSALATAYSDYLITEKNYAGKTHNGLIENIKNIFKMLKKRKLVNANPFEEVDKMKLNEGRTNAYTDEEKGLIIDYLKSNYHPLCLYIKIIYFCFIRPAEIMKIQVKHLDLENGTIKLLGENTKNGKNGLLPIPPELLLEMREKYAGLNPDLYLFGVGLVPNLKPTHRNRATASYKLVREKLKLSPEQEMYDWKHTGARDYILEGNNPYSLMFLMRHSSLDQTMKYLTSLGLMIGAKPKPGSWSLKRNEKTI